MERFKVAVLLGVDVIIDVEAENREQAQAEGEKRALALVGKVACPDVEVSLIDSAVVHS